MIPPIIGNEVGVFAWYEHGTVFTDDEYTNLHNQLSNKSSESPGEYYDGTYAHGGNTYNVRVRKDGYILAWLPNDIEAVWDFDFSGDPPLSQRAIQSLMSNAGVSGFGFAKCYYYNFNYPSATKVRWFGKSHEQNSSCGPDMPCTIWLYSFNFTLSSPSSSYCYIRQHNYCYEPPYGNAPGGEDETVLDVLSDPSFNPVGSMNTITLFRWRDSSGWAHTRIKNNETVVCSADYSDWPATAVAKTVIVAFIIE